MKDYSIYFSTAFLGLQYPSHKLVKALAGYEILNGYNAGYEMPNMYNAGYEMLNEYNAGFEMLNVYDADMFIWRWNPALESNISTISLLRCNRKHCNVISIAVTGMHCMWGKASRVFPS